MAPAGRASGTCAMNDPAPVAAGTTFEDSERFDMVTGWPSTLSAITSAWAVAAPVFGSETENVPVNPPTIVAGPDLAGTTIGSSRAGCGPTGPTGTAG